MTTIRKATAADIPALLLLVQEYWRFEDLPGFDFERVANQLQLLFSKPQLGSCWIASCDGVDSGYLLAVYVFSLEHLGITAEIDEFFVLPSHQGSGTGSTLLDAAEAEFRRAGCTNVSLQLARQNSAARRFYLRRKYNERAGFELLDKTLLT